MSIDWGGSGSGSGSGTGSGSESGTPTIYGAGREITDGEFCNRGVVLQDQTGTYVLALSGTYDMWKKYHNDGISAAELAEQYPQSVKKVDPSNIKDSSSVETLKEGDIYHHSGDGKYYYVDKVNKYDQVPNGSWVPLIQ